MQEAATWRGDAGYFAQFRGAVLASPELQLRLGQHVLPDVYVADCLAIAADAGIALSAEAVHTQIPPDRAGTHGLSAATVILQHWPMAGWLPARASSGADGPLIDWVWFGDEQPTAPSYEESVRIHGSRPFNLMFRTRTTFDGLVGGAEREELRAPTGLIFHMSRCGSTLAARMLAAVPHHWVVPEPQPLDAVIQWVSSLGARPEQQVRAVRAIVGALGRSRTGTFSRYFVKLDSWHVLSLPLLRAAFPQVPWIFLHRDPVEVVSSLMTAPGLQVVPGGLPRPVLHIVDGELLSREDYAARVLARFCVAARQHWPLGGGLLVDYNDLPAAMFGPVPCHFGFMPDSAERAAMEATAGMDAKRPYSAFVPDSQRKRDGASPTLLAGVDRQLSTPYAALVTAATASSSLR